MDRTFYGHLEHGRFQSGVVPEAKGFKGSMRCHEFIGACDKATADKSGPLLVRDGFCACRRCRAGQWSQCELKRNAGQMRKVYTPVVQQVRGAQTMIGQLEEFAATLHARQLIAVRTPDKSFWLARAMERAYHATKDFFHSGNAIEEGSLLVNIKLFERCGGNYVLSDAEVPLIVNTAIRVAAIGWERTDDGKYYLGEDTADRIEAAI